MKLKILFIAFTIFCINNCYSQENIPANWHAIDFGNNNIVIDVNLVNDNLGFLIVLNNNTQFEIKKSTNKGYNWTNIGTIAKSYNSTPHKKASIYFVNENLGFISCNKGIYKYNNGNIELVKNYTIDNTTYDNLYNKIVYNNGTFYSLLTYSYYLGSNQYQERVAIFKSTNSGNNWNIVHHYWYQGYTSWGTYLVDIDIDKNNSDKVMACGYQNSVYSGGQNSLLIYSENGFATQGNNINISNGSLSFVDILPNSNIIFLHRGKQSETNQKSQVYNVNWGNWNNPQILFEINSPNYGAYNQTAMNYYDNNYGYILVDEKINENLSEKRFYKTTNGGNNWFNDYNEYLGGASSNDELGSISCLISGEIENLLFCKPDRYLYQKKIEGISILAKLNGITDISGIEINIEGNPYSTPEYNAILRPSFMVNCPTIIQSENIFYKWNNNSMSNNNLFIMNSEKSVIANYKEKLKSTTENAINIPSQTKAVRDNFGRINSIHTSMGGVFFTKSYNNGSNFTTEEIINDKYSGINSCATENNINPFINEALAIDGDPENISSERNVVAVWERREGNNVIIDYGQRHSIQFGYPYYWDPRGNPSPYRITINSENQNFKAYPKVFAKVMYENFLPDTTYDFLTLIAHLKPGGNNNQLVVTGKKSQGANPQEFIIDGDNIESFSAVRSSIGNNLVVHFSYKKNSHIFYKKVYFGIYNNSIYVDSNYYGQGCTIISEGDEQNSRFTPDISLRNGRPVIAYRGDCRKLRIISFEGNEPVTETIYNYPIIVRYKYFNGSNEVWSIFVKYNSAGNVFQDEPNVEGSKDALAYVVNFRVANSYFKKFVLIKDYPGYSCSPGTFYGKDAKLVRGSYQGNFGTNSYPTLLTLTQNGSLYDVWKQTFTILPNTPVFEYPNTNLVGVIRDLDINYYFNLGPIIAKNIICSLEDDLETVVENPVEFNENMISQPFSLSNGDTLLVGGLGSYSYYPGCDFRIKKFDVNLLIKSTNQLQRNLFSDTIQYEDSIETEYLRGFIIDNIQNGTDSFYIQLVVAPEDITDGSFLYSNVYSPDEEGGDNPGGTKSRYVLFEKGKSGYNQNIPTEYSLSQNYPNPFNPVTKIQFDIPKNGLVSLKVYDVLGREVKNIVNEVKSAGRYTVLLDGSDLSSGVYFYRIESGDFVQVKRMVLLK